MANSERGISKKIIVLIICVVVVLAGCIVAVAVLKKPASKAEDTTAPETEIVYEEVTEVQSSAENVTEAVTDEQGSVIATENATDEQGNILTTIVTTIKTVTKKTVVTKSATTTKKGQTTTKKATTTSSATAGGTTAPQAVSNGSGGGIIDDMIGDDAEQSLVGYRYSSTGHYYYCDDKDNWQVHTGYNEVYDKWAGTMGMFIDQVRVRFEYEDKGWMVQLWKGQYGFVLIGAEIGLYTCDIDDYNPSSTDFHHFNAADQSDWLNMSLTMYYRAKGDTGAFKPMFSRPYAKYWWCTGFVKGQLSKYTAPRTELKTLNRITFKTTEMANIYVNQLSSLGFGRAASSSALSDDTYAQNGADVYVLWSSIYNDSFSGSIS